MIPTRSLRLDRVTRAAIGCICLSLPSLTACANRANRDESLAVLTQRTVGYDVLWTKELASPEMFALGSRQLGGVALSAAGIAVATLSDGRVVAVDAATGGEKWSANCGGGAFAGAPAISGNTVVIAAPNGTVFGFDLSSGTELWATTTGALFRSTPTIDQDLVFVVGANSALYALDLATGDIRWQYSHRSPGQLSIVGDGRPLVTSEFVFVGFADGAVGKFARATGETLWFQDLASSDARFSDADPTPLMVGSLLVASSFDGGILALDSLNGQIVWRAGVTGAASVHLVGDKVVAATADGEVVWLSAESGELLQTLRLDTPSSGPIVRSGSYLVAPTEGRGLIIIDPNTAWIHNIIDVGPGFSSLPAASGERLSALSDGGVLYGFRLWTSEN